MRNAIAAVRYTLPGAIQTGEHVLAVLDLVARGVIK
jgi:hypothetical protein